MQLLVCQNITCTHTSIPHPPCQPSFQPSWETGTQTTHQGCMDAVTSLSASEGCMHTPGWQLYTYPDRWMPLLLYMCQRLSYPAHVHDPSSLHSCCCCPLPRTRLLLMSRCGYRVYMCCGHCGWHIYSKHSSFTRLLPHTSHTRHDRHACRRSRAQYQTESMRRASHHASTCGIYAPFTIDTRVGIAHINTFLADITQHIPRTMCSSPPYISTEFLLLASSFDDGPHLYDTCTAPRSCRSISC